ncbi:MAG TPA: response regulator [Caulobacteraceae bacterium]|jgi:CheY-like chemotaxis protein|nr:response regulator [Caulobacteraceae bacterium]
MPVLPVRALVVDDNPGHRQLLTAVLQSKGLDVFAVNDGREAVAIASSTCFALILMDASMPIMDGHTATRLIREHEVEAGWPRANIIMVTSHDTSADVARSRAAGADGHVNKPINVGELVAAIDARRARAARAVAKSCAA